MTDKSDRQPEPKILNAIPPDDIFRAGLIECLSPLRRFSMILCHNKSASDDLVQATCERALQRWQQFHSDTKMQSWLFTIMHSIWKNELRSIHNRRTAFHKQTTLTANVKFLGRLSSLKCYWP